MGVPDWYEPTAFPEVEAMPATIDLEPTSYERSPGAGFDCARRSSTYWRGETVTGWTFGRGGDLSVRVYDKTEELRMRAGSAESAAARAAASDKAAAETEIWARNGWTEGEGVTRVEVQVRGTALSELCERCETRVRPYDSPEDYERAVDEACEAMCRMVEESIDGMWAYATQKWLRYVEPTRTRRRRCPPTAWWQLVQNVEFCRHCERPLKRRRRRSAIRSAQALGCALSLVASQGVFSPWIDTRAQWWLVPDEEAVAKRLEAGGMAEHVLRDEVARVFDRAAKIATHDLLFAAGSARRALERFVARFNAASARYAPEGRGRSDGLYDGPRLASAYPRAAPRAAAGAA